MPTIATHNGSSVCQQHNRRAEKVVSKEEHIFSEGAMRPNGREAHSEIWIDVPEKEAYENIFGGAVRAYNAKQKRADRKIEDYYKKVQSDKKQHTSYEMIVGVYGADISVEEHRQILREYAAAWSERNPNLKLIGAYYHDDELGEGPHLHMDYIPVASGYTRGMRIQNGLNRALEQQGYESRSINQTAQIEWERSENQALEDICKAHGLHIDHPQQGRGVEHLHTEAYKVTQEIEQAREKLVQIDGQIITAEELKHEIADKTLFGRVKETVTLDYTVYRNMDKTIKEIGDVLELKRELDERRSKLNERSSELDRMAADIQPRYEYAQRLESEAMRKEVDAQRHMAQAEEYERNQQQYILREARDIGVRTAEKLYEEWENKYHASDDRLESFMDFLKEGQKDPSVIDRLYNKFEEREAEISRSWGREYDYDFER